MGRWETFIIENTRKKWAVPKYTESIQKVLKGKNKIKKINHDHTTRTEINLDKQSTPK